MHYFFCRNETLVQIDEKVLSINLNALGARIVHDSCLGKYQCAELMVLQRSILLMALQRFILLMAV